MQERIGRGVCQSEGRCMYTVIPPLFPINRQKHHALDEVANSKLAKFTTTLYPRTPQRRQLLRSPTDNATLLYISSTRRVFHCTIALLHYPNEERHASPQRLSTSPTSPPPGAHSPGTPRPSPPSSRRHRQQVLQPNATLLYTSSTCSIAQSTLPPPSPLPKRH